jgi:hypothetical protein
MELDKYQMIEMIAQDEEHETFKAYDSSDGHNVFMHAIRVTTSAGRPSELLEFAKSVLATYKGPEILLTGIRGGRFCVITEPRQECRDIRKWLQDRGRAAVWSLPQLEKSPEEAPKAAHSASGVFATRESQPAAPPASDPGEFTRRFQAHSSTNAASPEPAPEPGEFTRKFSAAELSGGSRFPGSEGGESRSDPGESGDFSQRFSLGKPTTPATSAFPSSGQPEPKLSWDALARPSEAAGGAFKAVDPQPPVTLPQEGPSDYSRVIKAPTSPKPEPPPPPTAPPAVLAPAIPAMPAVSPAPIAETLKTAPSYLPLIVIMASLLLMAVMLVLYFAIKT